MTFLNPLVLFGLAAAAIPVILHLLNLRKLKTIDFSTLTFLKELQQTKIRRLRFRQILLLIVRTLIVIAIVLAFARPALRGRILGTIGSHAHSSVVLILDDSFSLAASDEHGERFKQVRDAALKTVDLLRDGDEIFLIRLSDLPEVTVEPASHEFESVRTVIREMSISTVRRPLEEALRVAARLLSQSANANKEIYVISDFQRTLLTREGAGEQSAMQLFDDRVRFFLVPVGSKLVANASIDSIAVTSKILEQNRAARLFASVRNFSTLPLRNEVVSVYLDNVRAAQTNVSVEPMGSASVEFTITPKRAGELSGYVELESDAIEFDNRKYFHLRVPSRLNVALVTSQRKNGEFLAAALRSSSTAGNESVIHIEEVPEQKFPLLDLKSIDVLICSGVNSFSASDVRKVKEFVARGGGLLLFPESGIDLGSYNTVLLPALEVPPMGSPPPPSQTPVTFRNVDLDHPLFETMFEKDARSGKKEEVKIESPAIVLSSPRQTGKQGRTLISLSNGNAFLSEYRLGQGRILFYSVAPTLAWSDFPLKGIFAPLIYRSVMYAGIGEEVAGTFTTGDAPTLALRVPRSGSPQVRLLMPDRVEDLLQAASASGGDESAGRRSFSLKRLTQQGIYELRNAGNLLASLAVNADRGESDTRIATGSELSDFWKHIGIQEASIRSLDAPDNLPEAVLHSRFGVELWQYCAMLALLLALAEMVIARDSRSAAGAQPA